MRPSWAVTRLSWAIIEPSWPSWRHVGPCWRPGRPSWAVLEPFESPTDVQWPPRDPQKYGRFTQNFAPSGVGGSFRRLQKPCQDTTWHSSTPQRAQRHGGGLYRVGPTPNDLSPSPPAAEVLVLTSPLSPLLLLLLLSLLPPASSCRLLLALPGHGPPLPTAPLSVLSWAPGGSSGVPRYADPNRGLASPGCSKT